MSSLHTLGAFQKLGLPLKGIWGSLKGYKGFSVQGSQKIRSAFLGPYSKEFSILVSILGSLYLDPKPRTPEPLNP